MYSHQEIAPQHLPTDLKTGESILKTGNSNSVHDINLNPNKFTEVPNLNQVTEFPNLNKVTEVPNFNNVTEVPNFNKVTEVPNFNNVTEVPNFNKVTEVPNFNNVTEVSNFNNVTEVPNFNKVSEVPNFNNVTEVPNLNKVTEVPDFNKFTEASNFNNVTEVPNFNKVTEVPNFNKVTEVPNFNKVSEVSNFNKVSEVPNCNKVTEVPNFNKVTAIPNLNNIIDSNNPTNSNSDQGTKPSGISNRQIKKRLSGAQIRKMRKERRLAAANSAESIDRTVVAIASGVIEQKIPPLPPSGNMSAWSEPESRGYGNMHLSQNLNNRSSNQFQKERSNFLSSTMLPQTPDCGRGNDNIHVSQNFKKSSKQIQKERSVFLSSNMLPQTPGPGRGNGNIHLSQNFNNRSSNQIQKERSVFLSSNMLPQTPGSGRGNGNIHLSQNFNNRSSKQIQNERSVVLSSNMLPQTPGSGRGNGNIHLSQNFNNRSSNHIQKKRSDFLSSNMLPQTPVSGCKRYRDETSPNPVIEKPQKKRPRSLADHSGTISFKMAIVNDSNMTITDEQFLLIQTAILNKSLEQQDVQPMFTGICLELGVVMVYCHDESTAKWIVGIANELMPWEGARLRAAPAKTIPLGLKVIFAAPDILKSQPVERILRLVEGQNYGLSTSQWKIVNAHESEKSKRIVVRIDPDSWETIKSRNRYIFLGFGKILVSSLEKS